MYAPELIAAQQQLLEAQAGDLLPGGVLERVPVTQCHTMVRDLAKIWDPEKAQQTRPFSQEEEAFVTNESMLAKIDYRYAAERYIYINFEGQSLRPMYPLWESQELILQEVARIELQHWQTGHPDGILGNILKGRQLGACVNPLTHILTADLRWVVAEELEVGTFVVSVDEDIPGGRGASRKMRTAVVEARQVVYEPTCEIELASGALIVCSTTHRWLYRTRTQSSTGWRAVGEMKVGGAIRRITEPWGVSTYEDGWIGGMFDGEGSGGAKPAGGAEICISQVYGPVYDRVTRYFEERGYRGFHQDPPDVRKPGGVSKFGGKPVGKISLARMDEIFRVLGQARPTKLLAKHWWEGKELPGKRNGYGWDVIVAIRPLGTRKLIDLQTSTGTFIAEGLVSHNSTLCQSFLAHRCLTHGHVRTLIASDVPQNSGSEGLFGMLELVVEHWPWWLKPREKFHTKNHHLMWANGSRVIVESGKSMKGGLQEEGAEKGQIGRSKTYSAFHLSEITSWERPEQINSSLLPAVPYTPRTFGMRESTAMGRNNYWHTEWKIAAAGEDPRFFNVFVPWYAEQSKYWLPYPDTWIPSDETLNFARRATDQGPRYMHRPVQLRKEQLYWYELHRNAAVKREELYRFLSEYPSEPEEAFQNSGRSIFSIETQTRVGNQARPLADLWVVAPRAELIADKEASLREFAESQRQLRTASAAATERSALQVLEVNTPVTIQEETPTLTEIEP